MILVSNFYNVELVEANTDIETVWCEFVINKEKFVIGVIYRPPSSDLIYFNTMLDLTNLMCDIFKNNDVILFGNFNLRSINWIDFVSIHSDVMSVQFLDCALSNSLNQVVNSPIRLNNILDLVLCKNFYLESAVRLTSPLGNTNHEFLSFSVDLSYFSYIHN